MLFLKICQSIDGHLGYMRILTIVNNTAMTIEVHVSFRISFCFLWVYNQSGIAGS